MSWQDFVNAMRKPWDSASNWYGQMQEIPNKASDIAEMTYPNSARDASTQNAYRHALGTGMMAHHFGGGYIGAALARMAGWGWEAGTQLDPRSTAAQREDSNHDLNANAIGAHAAIYADSQAELERVLKSYADRAVVAKPPAAYALTPGYMTRSVR